MARFNSSEIEKILIAHGIRPTANRILVAGTIATADYPVSQMEIEDLLQTVDRSTVSRSVAVFQDAGLLHNVDDGSGMMKYEICHAAGEDVDDDAHVHFRCRKCGRTSCFHHIPVPQVEVPEGYVVEHSNYVITGICPQCASR